MRRVQERFEASPLKMPHYDVVLDGRRFLTIEPGEEDRPPGDLDIVLNSIRGNVAK